MESPFLVSFTVFALFRCVKGACVALDMQTYRCDCEEGYRGALCNLKGEPSVSCQDLQCLHGQCQVTEEGERCICEQGYSGESCDIGEEGRGLRVETQMVYSQMLFRRVTMAERHVRLHVKAVRQEKVQTDIWH